MATKDQKRKAKITAKKKALQSATQITTSNFIHRFNKERKIAREKIRETHPTLCPIEEDKVKF